MSGIKESQNAFQQAKAQMTPDEMDRYEQYQVIHPSVSATFVGTAAGTQTQSVALTLSAVRLDYPRNLLYGIVGTADVGGTLTVSGKDQFGQVISESVGSGTAAAGTPAFAIAGTKIFAEVTGGTVTFATSAGQGNGTARVGVAIGTATTAKFWIGLPTKIAGTSDIKNITWIKENVQTTLNGGTIHSTTYINTTTHAISGSSVMAGTEVYSVLFKSTHDNSGKVNMAGL